MIVLSFCMLIAICISKIAEAYSRENHFGNPCVLCKCFVEYTDRDMPITFKPYAIAIDGYSSTEDQCLATCLKDKRCKTAVYGLIGGRDVFTCELYEEKTLNQLIYAPNVNMYLPKKKSDCKVYYHHMQSLKTLNRHERVTKRKIDYLTLFGRRNPFAFG